jgi:hypothetical protein
MQKNNLLTAFFLFFSLAMLAQNNTYSPCYYSNVAIAQELYKNGDTKTALKYFEQARTEAKAYHRTDIIAAASCYAANGDKTATFALLKTALDKGRRFDWFENVYYFDALKTEPEWQNIAKYEPKGRFTARAHAYHDLIHGITHEMEDVFMQMEKDPNAAARLPVLDSAAAAILVETMTTIGLPNEGELDDEDVQEFLGLYIKTGMYNQKTYDFLREKAALLLRSGIFRAKEYASMIDTWNSQWSQPAVEGDTVLPVFGNDTTPIGSFTKEQLAQINSNRIAIGLLPYGMDISPESLKKIDTIIAKNCEKPPVKK